MREALLPWEWRPERVVRRGCRGGRDDDVCGSSSISNDGGGGAFKDFCSMAVGAGGFGEIGLLEFVVLLLARSSSNRGLEAALSISCISKLFR